MADANAYVPEFIADYNRRFARHPASAHDAHRAMLEHERLDRVFTWQEECCVTANLTLHYKRVMYLLEPSDRARAAAGKYVLVRETEAGEVVIEHKGVGELHEQGARGRCSGTAVWPGAGVPVSRSRSSRANSIAVHGRTVRKQRTDARRGGPRTLPAACSP